MKTKILQLINEYHNHNKINRKIDDSFVNYCLLYIKNEQQNLSIREIENEIKEIIAKKSESVKKIYSEMSKVTETEYKIIKSIILISKLRKIKRCKIAKDEIMNVGRTTNTISNVYFNGDMQDNNKIYYHIAKYIKKGALGFKINVFDDYAIYKSKDILESHIYEIVFNIYQIANIYKKLKSNSSYVSKAQMSFYTYVEKVLKEYEDRITEQKIDLHNKNIQNKNEECYKMAILKFYISLYRNMLDLQYINQMNECFKENPKNPYSTLKKLYQGIEEAKLRYEMRNESLQENTNKNISNNNLHEDSNIITTEKLNNRNININNNCSHEDSNMKTTTNISNRNINNNCLPEDSNMIRTKKLYNQNVDFFTHDFHSINSIERIVVSHLNRMTNQLINTGTFEDVANEYFITKNKARIDFWDIYTIDYGLIPYFIKESDAVKINYIGKCMYILNKTEKYETNYKIDILLELKVLNKIIQKLNKKISKILGLKENLETVKNIFLFKRCDFVETLSTFLIKHENKNLFNRTISYILENAMVNTFGKLNEFMKKIDVCILENEQSWNCISLFCQLNFPLNLIFTKEIIFKLVNVFKFLWKVKKIESLIAQLKKKDLETSSRIKIIMYNNLINKFMFYFCYEVIESEFRIEDLVSQNDVHAYFDISSTHKENINDVDTYTNITNVQDFKNKSYSTTNSLIANNEEINGLLIDELRYKINAMLDKIIKRIFLLPESGKKEFDVFLTSLETLLMLVGKTNLKNFTDDDVKKNLSEFVARNESLLTGTNLHNLKRFVY